jgi:hypothetical protein
VVSELGSLRSFAVDSTEHQELALVIMLVFFISLKINVIEIIEELWQFSQFDLFIKITELKV